MSFELFASTAAATAAVRLFSISDLSRIFLYFKKLAIASREDEPSLELVSIEHTELLSSSFSDDLSTSLASFSTTNSALGVKGRDVEELVSLLSGLNSDCLSSSVF